MLRQENGREFEAPLGYLVSSRSQCNRVRPFLGERWKEGYFKLFKWAQNSSKVLRREREDSFKAREVPKTGWWKHGSYRWGRQRREFFHGSWKEARKIPCLETPEKKVSLLPSSCSPNYLSASSILLRPSSAPCTFLGTERTSCPFMLHYKTGTYLLCSNTY